MQKVRSYKKNSGDFINKVGHMRNIPEGTILETAGAVDLYSSILPEVELNALRVVLDNRDHKSINTKGLKKMAEFVLKHSFFEFNGKVKQKNIRNGH